MKIVYFETSAVNFIADRMSPDDAISTKKFQLGKGREWCISPVTLIEVLQTSDEERRDHLISISQRLFSENLMASPEEIFIHYFQMGFPVREKKIRLTSDSRLSRVWRDIVREPDRMMGVDVDLNLRAKAFKKQSKIIHQAINSIDEISPNPPSELDEVGNMIFFIDRSFKSVKFDDPQVRRDPEHIKIYKLALIYMMCLMCAQAGPCSEITEALWNKIGIDDTGERSAYALHNWQKALFKGPLYHLASMAYAQSKGRFSRGTYNDCLHAMYISYADLIFSEDGHFEYLKEEMCGSIYFPRIQSVRDTFISEKHSELFNRIIT